VLDEATSALDDGNEEKIHQALLNLHGSLTVIIIAHRKRTVQNADMIVDLTGYDARLISLDEFNHSGS